MNASLAADVDASGRTSVDASGGGSVDASPPGYSDMCAQCGRSLDKVRRTRVTRFCGQRCRQAAWDFKRQVRVVAAAARPMRFIYVDPPYPGRARCYYRKHRDYRGEVPHNVLLDRILAAAPDGWALSTAEDSLQMVLDLCTARNVHPRIGSWGRGSRPGRTRGPRSSWEPVLYVGGRELVRDDWVDDSLTFTARPRRSDPARVIGAKPPTFCSWLFDLWGAAASDELADWFPGSGGVGRAWVLRGGILLPDTYLPTKPG